jgi:uncharacterized integral membrane protein (TIGR00698 family)
MVNSSSKQRSSSKVRALLALDGGVGVLALMVLAVLPALWLQHPAVGLAGGAACALLLGRNPLPASTRLAKMSLQTAIVLLGLTMNAGALLSLSQSFSGAVTAYVVAAIGMGWLVAKLFRVDVVTASLLTLGTAICGGTAIAACAPFFKADAARIGLALGAVFLLNMVALFAFPPLAGWLGMSQLEFGGFAALAVHDTSSVVATAAVYGEEAAEVATTVKLGRTLWLVPVVVVLGMWKNGERGRALLQRARVPLFVVAFIAAAVVATLFSLPAELLGALKMVSKVLLVLALFFVGLELTRATLARLGGREGVFALGLWVLMLPVAYVLVMLAT